MGRILPPIAVALAMAFSSPSHAVSNANVDTISVAHLDQQQRRDLDCMSRNIYHEARGSTYHNQLAVAMVVRNRQMITGRTACQVIFAPGQFSWTARRHGPPAEQVAWRNSQRLAYLVLFTEGVEDITMGATHFHETTIRPSWARRATHRQVIGAHVFLRLNGYEQVAQSRY